MDQKGQFSTGRDPLSTDAKATSHGHREIRALMTRDHGVIHSSSPAIFSQYHSGLAAASS